MRNQCYCILQETEQEVNYVQLTSTYPKNQKANSAELVQFLIDSIHRSIPKELRCFNLI